MNKPNVAGFFRGVRTVATKHSSEILTGIGIAGMVTTTVLAVKATPKAIRLIEEAKEELGYDFVEEPMPKIEVVKACWKCYIPAAATCVASVACLIGASAVGVRRNAALATAYKLSEKALSEYKDGVLKTVGERKEKTIRENINKERAEKATVTHSEVILTEKGNTLCLDVLSGRHFKSDIDKIKRSVNNLNERMLNDPFGYVSLNEFYDELGLSGTKFGDMMGWCTQKGQIKLDYDACLTSDGDPCIVIDYVNPPEYNFDKFM